MWFNSARKKLDCLERLEFLQRQVGRIAYCPKSGCSSPTQHLQALSTGQCNSTKKRGMASWSLQMQQNEVGCCAILAKCLCHFSGGGGRHVTLWMSHTDVTTMAKIIPPTLHKWETSTGRSRLDSESPGQMFSSWKQLYCFKYRGTFKRHLFQMQPPSRSHHLNLLLFKASCWTATWSLHRVATISLCRLK